MTVLDVSRKLFDFFSKNDVFTLKDKVNVSEITGNEDWVDTGIIVAALKGMESQGIVIAINNNSSDAMAWALTKPLQQYTQTIELNFATITALTNAVNEFCDINGLEQEKVNPIAIDEQDIQNILLIHQNLKNSLENLNK